MMEKISWTEHISNEKVLQLVTCSPLAPPQPAHPVQGSCPGLVLPKLIGQGPVYLADLCCPLTARSTRHLRSAEQGLLHVPFARTSTMQSRAFSVGGPLVWNGLSLALQSLPRVFSLKFLQQLKTTLFGSAEVGSASE